MVHRSVIVQLALPSFAEAIVQARALFDELWQCDEETRPYNITVARAAPDNKGRWAIIVEAEDA